jgi:hypothetical protein
LFLLFSDNLAVVLGFLALHDKHNTCIHCNYKINLHSFFVITLIYQLLAHGRWLTPGTPASSITKTGRYDTDEILLKVAINTIDQSRLNKYTYHYRA